MAIAFARARYLSRSTGGSAVRSASYNAREAIADERTGEHYSFKHQGAPEHHEVLLPEGADPAFGEAGALWNAAEAAERRKDAQVARELVMALPADRELGHEDRVELVRSFALQHFVSRGLAVQLDVHAPHAGDVQSERANWHAHLLVTTRRVEGDHLAARKARELEPEVKWVGGRAVVTEGERWGELWRQHQDRYFALHGLELRVDAPGAVPQEHVGPIRMRTPGSEAVLRAEAIEHENAAAARDPAQVLAALTRNNATFSERDLDRFLARHLKDQGQHLAVKGDVLGHAEVLALFDRETGEAMGRYTTRAVREQERVALAEAEAVTGGRHRALGEAAKTAALDGRHLRADQRAAFEHASGTGGLRIVEGRAGTGKSYTLGAIRAAHEAAGYTVLGLAPTNAVAQDLKADGFKEAGTVHAELFRLKNGRTQWGGRTLVVVDEAAMLDSRISGELLVEARRSGAKLVLAGDDRQLASIERGGLFGELRERHGSAVISQVTRQLVDWQRQAAGDLAEGRVEEAVRAFAREGAITWTRTQEEARQQLVERWQADTAADPAGTRFVFAYTNKDVDELNAALRQVRVERGELGPGVRLETKHGAMAFAVGDRVQFTGTLRRARIYNGNAGTITAIEPGTGVLRAVLDGPGGPGREVSWSARELDGFRHGYAGTIYKGQGRTLDHTYLYHSHHWRQASSYVALTRQRESARIFAATETARDVAALARQMARGEERRASLAWATREELPAALRRAQVEGEGRGAGSPAGQEAAAATKSDQAQENASAPGQGWLIAPRLPAGGIDPGEVAAAVAASAEVQRGRRALGSYLEGAYRDPAAAMLRLEELVASHGPTSAAQRLVADPGQLGELRGRKGLLAGAAARQERARAERVAQAIGPAVARLGEAEAGAAAAWRKGVEARRAAEATGVPGLSARAQAAVGAITAAKDEAGRVKAWAGLQADKVVAGEVESFLRAVERRFGSEGMRALERSGTLEGARVGQAEHGSLRQVGGLVQALRGAQRAAAGQAQRLGATARMGQGARLKL